MQNITHGRLFVAASYLMIVSIFCSHFLLSVSLILFALLALFRYKSTPNYLIRNRHFLSASLGIFKWPFLAFGLIYLIHILSGVNSENISEYMRHLQVKLPYLVLPIVFLNHQTPKRGYHNFYYFFILTSCVMLGGVLIHYILNFEEYTVLIGKGAAIPTPLNHTKFSILLVIALNAAIILARTHWKIYTKRFQIFLGLAIVFLFLGLHVLAVRSGLASFYFSFVVLAIGYSLKRGKYLLLLGMIVACMLLPYAAYHTIPSFKKKVAYTVYDYKMWKENGGQGYNDAERLRSYAIGLELCKKSPLLGVGIGDIHDDVKRLYQQKYTKGNPRQPHNQFLFAATAFGVLGLIIYLGAYFIPFFWNGAYKDPLLLSFFLVLTAFCMIEKPLERSSFIALHCFLVLYSLRTKK